MKQLILLLTAIVFSVISLAQVSTLNESFETWPADGWSDYKYEEGGWAHSILWGANQGYNGGNCAHHKIANGATDDWLVSPQVSIESGNYELVFFEKSVDLQYYTYAGIHISTASGDPEDGDFVEIAESLQVEGSWVEHNIDLSAYNGQNIYIAFVFQGASSCWTDWEVDEVSISPSSYTDGALTQIVNPVGINPTPSVENVIITLHNYGSETITDFDIDWSVNSNSQTSYHATGLNIGSGEDLNITVGSYNFDSPGDYLISFDLVLADDMNENNNHIEGTYYVSEPNDAALIKIKPEGYFPTEGLEDIIVSMKNEGEHTIENVSVVWQVDEVAQVEYENNTISLAPGETIDLIIGQYDFPTGVHTIFAELIISADEDLSNNTKSSLVSINTFWESFEGDTFLPELWSNDNYPFRDYFFPLDIGGDLYYIAQVDNNMFGEVCDTLYTPLLEIEAGDLINFWVSNSAYYTTNDFLIWKDGTSGEVHLIGEIDSQLEQWDEISMDISSAAGINYIGFVNNNTGGYGSSSLDLISSDANIYLFDNDLGIKSLEFDKLAKIDLNHEFNVKIKNYGHNNIEGTNYNIKIIDDNNNLIAQQEGVSIDAWEEATITVNYTFTDIQNINVYAYIDYSNDQQTKNNTSITYRVVSAPEDVETQDIGYAEAQNLMIPFNTGGDTWTFGTDDISQTIYYFDEIGSNGYIYGIYLHYNEIMAVGQTLPLQVSAGTTDLTNLSAGWVTGTDLQMVFDGSIEVYPGINSVYIPFDEPFLFTGNKNLIIQYYQYSPSWPFTACRFYATNDPSGAVRSIRLNDVEDLDPNDIPDSWGTLSDVPFTTFAYQTFNEQGVIAGTISKENNDPIENATITVEGVSITVNSNENGNYTLPELPYESYSITTTALGYITQTKDVTVDQDNITLDFTLESFPLISLSATVLGSNNNNFPLENVTITLSGYADFESITNANGEFVIANVYGTNEYTVSFELYGYHSYSETIDILSEDYDMGEIILQEEHISAFNVQALAGNGQAFVEWISPASSEKNKLQKDQGQNLFSLTNEPNENVYLGNYFEASGLTTITSVEVLWDDTEHVNDYVTLAIINNNNEEILTSMPFLTQSDSLMTIDLPNLTVDGGFYAMIHWKDNAETTHALAFDYSDDTPNTAYIMYPGYDPILISDYLVAPDASFILRVNTLQEATTESSKTVSSYNIYKGLSSLIHEAPWGWEQINSDPITELFYYDYSGNDSPGLYTYAVEAIYEEGDADYCFSNFIDIIIGISDIEYSDLGIYPNPASSIVYLENTVADILEIYNSLGAKVYSESGIPSNASIDISHLENGYYMIILTQGDTQSVTKLIVSK